MQFSGPNVELEFLILGMVSQEVNSGYAIRKAMTKMKGSRWSSESGSVYRVLRRLESDGYVEITGKVGVPNRERTEYKITPAGVKAMQEWVRLPPEPAEWGYLVDPIRTRCYFLSQLPAREQQVILRTWILESRSFISVLETEAETFAEGDAFQTAAFENLIFLANARHLWLKKMLAVSKELERATVAGVAAE